MPAADETTEVTLGEVYRAVLRIDEAVNGNGRPGLKQDTAGLVTWVGEHDKRHDRESQNGTTIHLNKKTLTAILGAVASVAGLIATIVGMLHPATPTP